MVWLIAYRTSRHYDWHRHARNIERVTAVTTLPGIAYGASALASRIPTYERGSPLHYPGQRELESRRFVYEK